MKFNLSNLVTCLFPEIEFHSKLNSADLEREDPVGPVRPGALGGEGAAGSSMRRTGNSFRSDKVNLLLLKLPNLT